MSKSIRMNRLSFVLFLSLKQLIRITFEKRELNFWIWRTKECVSSYPIADVNHTTHAAYSDYCFRRISIWSEYSFKTIVISLYRAFVLADVYLIRNEPKLRNENKLERMCMTVTKTMRDEMRKIVGFTSDRMKQSSDEINHGAEWNGRRCELISSSTLSFQILWWK